MPQIRPRLLAILFVCVLAFAAAWGAHFFASSPAPSSEAQDRYYRAVHLLQSLGGPAAGEEEAIPSRIIYSDATESLRHHPDKILVLHRAADDLETLRAEFPRAGLFEAYARMALGERAEAARLLALYVAEGEYRPLYYALLCENLAESGDYVSLLLFCREWREKDPSCNRDRIRHAVSALYNSGRYREALETARSEEVCLGWEAEVYAAKALLGQGEAEQARRSLQKAEERYTENADRIRRLWEILRVKTTL
ncbi:MAG: hypothetical protein LBN33_10885 [Desulfovibrio sp.]|jgi:hypothetical protein|nr:hypothetical protein [Desulfovibrio sp.]